MYIPTIEGSLLPRVHTGPLLADLLASGPRLEDYVRDGGYRVAARVVNGTPREEVLRAVDAAGLRGRGGGGFPTAIKWRQVLQSPHPEKYFVCNVHAGQPGGFKERFLLTTSPHQVLEAVTVAGLAVGANAAILFLGNGLEAEERILLDALAEAGRAGLVGPPSGGPEIFVYRSPGGYITGEETAALELLEGRVGRPRGKPSLPTQKGLLGCSTVVNNLETVLHAFFIAKHGPERFRETGTADAPGTLVFSLSGEIELPGLYELPLGTSLRELLFDLGGGGAGKARISAVLPGGVASGLLGKDSFDVALDFDSLRDAGADLGSGTVIVISEATASADLAIDLARFYHQASCGKCQPCKDGTGRVSFMLEHLDQLDQRSVDLADKPRQPSLRKGLTVLQESNSPGGISYTDTVEGLEKIRHLAEWFKYRGDCHHATEAATAIQSVLDLFGSTLEEHRLGALLTGR